MRLSRRNKWLSDKIVVLSVWHGRPKDVKALGAVWLESRKAVDAAEWERSADVQDANTDVQMERL